MDTNDFIDKNSVVIYARELHIFTQKPFAANDDRETGNSPLHWTASKASLVELIYSLQSAAAFNSGSADIKLITSVFEQIFAIQLGNIYNVFQEIRLRKKSRSSFLDLLHQRLIQRMDEADENPR